MIIKFSLLPLYIDILQDLGKVWASLIAQLVKNLPAVQETLVRFLDWEDLVRFLDWEDPLEKGQATDSSIPELPLWLSR